MLVVYGDGSVIICGGSMWIWPLRMTGSDVSHVTGRGHIRKYVLRMRNMKLHNIRRRRAFSPEVTPVTWPEEALSGSDRVRMRNRKLRNRFPRFFLL